jgi:hypothetical protein
MVRLVVVGIVTSKSLTRPDIDDVGDEREVKRGDNLRAQKHCGNARGKRALARSS